MLIKIDTSVMIFSQHILDSVNTFLSLLKTHKHILKFIDDEHFFISMPNGVYGSLKCSYTSVANKALKIIPRHEMGGLSEAQCRNNMFSL